MDNPLSPRDRELLDDILDRLIPANPDRGIPSAGAFGVAGFIASRAADDDALAASVDALLARARRWPERASVEGVRELERESPADFARLVRCTYMGYYSRPEIRARVGVAPWPVHPLGYDVPVESERLLEELTAPVRSRGAVYRDVGTAAGRKRS